MIKIRKQLDTDQDAVKSIIATATDELRSIYRPVKNKAPVYDELATSLVAVVDKKVVASAQFLIGDTHLLIRQLAVMPPFRKQGVARALISDMEQRARIEHKTQVILSTIKETGNADIFLRLGFSIRSEETSTLFESNEARPVTLVTMSKPV